MGDKDTDRLFGNPELLICDPNGEMKPLGKVVESSISFESEEELSCNPGRNSYSFNFKADIDDDTLGISFSKPLRIAESMRESINDLIENYAFLRREGKLNRKERREREREIKKRLSRYISFCNENGLQIHIKQRQSW